ncbi:GAF domain-containing protein [Duganella sp. FT92W]|uniref:GAF domain-containing protein n=2 Tax=Pseudoduganella rivuli TaxID=2666085 RepID=A0A7X2IJK1_9BURK|nr:GAF domain-containing protein [Pseudoduganella rivuli]
MEQVMQIAKGGVEYLHNQVRAAGYVVLLTDCHGVTVDFQGDAMNSRELRRAGLYLGSCWSEAEEGTCAVGTCIADQHALTVHQAEHFRTTNTGLTCSAAPILDTDGALLAVLDTSALSSPGDKRSQALVLQLVTLAAKMIENAHFLKKFEDHWIIRLSRRREFAEVVTDGLMALDHAGRVIAVNRNIAQQLSDGGAGLIGRNVDQVFDTRFELLLAAGSPQHGQTLPLRSLLSGRQYYALMRPPCGRTVSPFAARPPRPLPAPAAVRTALTLHDLAGQDAHMTRNVAILRRVIDKGIAIMLQGETGTGKEAFASAIHLASERREQPFVALNCAAIPESLIESELFGYADGAFTGARAKGMRGKLLQAHGGTLFLDEIGDMPLAMQTRLLRVLAEKEILPLGAEKAQPVDVQIVCATHRNLLDLVMAGQFREDLYYRLNGMKLHLAPLRERSDIAAILRQVLAGIAAEAGYANAGFTDEALAALLACQWPGNLRQVHNVLRSALALSDNGEVRLEDLPAELTAGAGRGAPPARLAQSGTAPAGGEDAERETLVAALRRQRWNVTKTARELDLCRATIYRKMQRLGIVAPNASE